jgi:hypothetical protein
MVNEIAGFKIVGCLTHAKIFHLVGSSQPAQPGPVLNFQDGKSRQQRGEIKIGDVVTNQEVRVSLIEQRQQKRQQGTLRIYFVKSCCFEV